MADQGAIGNPSPVRPHAHELSIWPNTPSHVGALTIPSRKLAYLRKQATAMPMSGDPLNAGIGLAGGVISGIVQENGEPLPHCLVRLYHRESGLLVDSTFTDGDGLFAFTGYDNTKPNAWFAVAFDPVGGESYNALIFDRLTAYFDNEANARTISPVGLGAQVIGSPNVDRYLTSMVSLLHLNGANGSTTIVDERGKTWTVSGDAKISTAESKFGGSSLHIPGSVGDTIQCAANDDFNFGAGDYEIGGWFRFDALSYGVNQAIFGYSGGRGPYLSAAGDRFLFWNGSSNAFNITVGAAGLSALAWTHLCVSRVSGTTRFFVSGNSVASFTMSTTAGGIVIGAFEENGNSRLKGYVNEFYVKKGEGVSSNFTPRNTPY